MKTKRGEYGGALAIVLFFVVGFGLLVILNPVLRDALLPWTAYKAEVASAEGVVDRTYNPDNAIYNYEWFKRQEEKIHATEQQIENTVAQRKEYLGLYGDPKNWTWQQQEEYARLSMNVRTNPSTRS